MEKRKVPPGLPYERAGLLETGAHSQLAHLCGSHPRLCGGNTEPPAPGELSDRLQQLETRGRVEKKCSETRGLWGRWAFKCCRTYGRSNKHACGVRKEPRSRTEEGRSGLLEHWRGGGGGGGWKEGELQGRTERLTGCSSKS